MNWNSLESHNIYQTFSSQKVFHTLPTWAVGVFNSLVPGRFGWAFRNVIFSLVLLTDVLRSSYDYAPMLMPWDRTDKKLTLVQVMAWCHQATNHYLNQCWPRSTSPYDVTKPQWVNNFGKYRPCLRRNTSTLETGKAEPFQQLSWSKLKFIFFCFSATPVFE